VTTALEVRVTIAAAGAALDRTTQPVGRVRRL
jgi:hypothetical protein